MAVVTGGGRGIGRAIALAFAQAEADLVLVARGEDAPERTAREIGALGRGAVPIVADLADPEAAQRMIDRTVDEFGTLDILVNNAGAAPFVAPIAETRIDGFERYFRVNFPSAFYATRAAGRVLPAGDSGCVSNIASVDGLIAGPGLAYYGPARTALINLTRLSALEWATSGVRVNAVAPGCIDTPMNATLREDPETERRILADIPMGRLGRPEDVAAAALFLCSPAAPFITGAVLVADGGQTVTSHGVEG